MMKYCSGGDLNAYLHHCGPLPEPKAKKILLQILNGVEYLSSQNIIHYDLKPLNVLLEDKLHVRIADFGLSKRYDKGDTCVEVSTPGNGTPCYQLPECFCNKVMIK
jgi:serine/threonine protein kinase